MAYNITATDATTYNELKETVGSYSGFAAGVALAVSTTATVTVPQLKTIEGVVVTNQTSEASASTVLASTSGNTFTVTTDSGGTVHWIAWGSPRS